MDDETKKRIQKERCRIYREANRDKAQKYRDDHKAETKAYYLKNRDIIIQNQVIYRKNNPEMLRAKQKLDRQKPATQQRQKEYQRQYRQKKILQKNLEEQNNILTENDLNVIIQ